MSTLNRLLQAFRECITPLLPPPLLAVIRRIDLDSTTTSVLGSESAMKIIIASIFLLIAVNIILSKNKVRNQTSRRRIVVDYDTPLEESVLTTSDMATSQDKYDDTVILIGPSQSGKTFLFHKLLISLSTTWNKEDSTEAIPQSVISLRANIEILSIGPVNIRLIDYPGHVQLLNQLDSLLIPPTKSNTNTATTRIILVVDSTKSVHDASTLIYKYLFSDPVLLKAWQQRQRTNEKDILKILVVCSRSDEKDAKNWRRIKLQLKAELDHLRNLSMQSSTNSHDMEQKRNNNIAVDKKNDITIATLLGETINLDDLGSDIPLEFHFLSLSGSFTVDDTSFKAVRAFVGNGDIIEKNSPVNMKQKL